jgi:hypothetical protein
MRDDHIGVKHGQRRVVSGSVSGLRNAERVCELLSERFAATQYALSSAEFAGMRYPPRRTSRDYRPHGSKKRTLDAT